MNTALATKIVEEYANEKVGEVSQIVNRGAVNEIFLVNTDKQKYILRTDPEEDNLVRFQKEAWCMEAASAGGIAVPEVFETGLADEHPYMIMSHIEGVNGDESDERDMIWNKLGEYARKIHSIYAEGYGEGMISPGVFNDSWSRYLDYNISSLTSDDKALTFGFITEEQQGSLKKVFLHLRNSDMNIGLMHQDLSLKNTIVSKDGAVYLIDWGCAGVGIVPHLDIAEILHSSLKDDSKEFSLFLKGYGMEREELENLKPQIEAVSLLRYTDKLRWAMDRKPASIGRFVKEINDRLERYEA